MDSIVKKYKGKEFDSINIKKISFEIIEFFEEKGYPFAEVRFVNFLKRGDTIDYLIEINKGKFAFIEGIDFDGIKRVNKEELRRIFRFRPCVFSKKIITDFKNKLYFFPFFSYENHYFYEKEGKLFLNFVLNEDLNNRLEIGVGYSNEEKKFFGNMNIHIDAFFNSLRTFDVSWRRIKRGYQDLLICYEEPFFYLTPMKIKGNYSLFQRDTLYIKENFDILFYFLVYPFKIGIGGSYEENRDFIIKEKIFRILNVAEIEGGRKTYFNSGFYLFLNSKYSKKDYFRIWGIYEGRKVFKKIGILTRIFYYNFIKKGIIISPEYFYVGGKDNLRGYDEEEFRVKEGSIFNFEKYFIPSKLFSPILFFDFGVLTKNFIKKSFGFGFIGETKTLSYKILFAFPYKENVYNGKVHFVMIQKF
ncbi:MAG: hypothetical protein ABIM60_04835 [candidate division WOR-3 bacterium]